MQRFEVLAELGEGVRNAVGKIHRVVFLLEIISERHFVIAFVQELAFLGLIKSRWLIRNTNAVLVPVCVFLTFNTHSHTMVVQCRALGEIQNSHCHVANVVLVLN